jgi:tRNA-modifying protein YgfZ
MPIKLSSSHLLELTGDDAVAFAHGQFSNDVLALTDDRWQWNTWLSPQGRVRAFFALLRIDATRLLVVLRGDGAIAFRDALSRFVLRANVAIGSVDHASLYGVDGTAGLSRFGIDVPNADAISRSQDRFAIALTPSRFIVIDKSASAIAAASDDDARRWRLADIRDGIPEIATALQDTALPQWLGLERLHAVSVRKGCYPGQEIMSRLHFKGGNKRGLYRIAIHGDAVPEAGSSIVEHGVAGHVGAIVMAERNEATLCEALAILPNAIEGKTLRLESAPAAPVEVMERFG